MTTLVKINVVPGATVELSFEGSTTVKDAMSQVDLAEGVTYETRLNGQKVAENTVIEGLENRLLISKQVKGNS